MYETDLTKKEGFVNSPPVSRHPLHECGIHSAHPAYTRSKSRPEASREDVAPRWVTGSPAAPAATRVPGNVPGKAPILGEGAGAEDGDAWLEKVRSGAAERISPPNDLDTRHAIPCPPYACGPRWASELWMLGVRCGSLRRVGGGGMSTEKRKAVRGSMAWNEGDQR